MAEKPGVSGLCHVRAMAYRQRWPSASPRLAAGDDAFQLNGMMVPQGDKEKLSRAFARIRTGALACVSAMIGGVGLFLITAWLLIKGGPHVGQHLQLLSNYFIGYS